MQSTIKRYWHTISYLGVDENASFSREKQVIQVFFNKCLAIGFVGLLSQVYYASIFIGNYAYFNVLSAIFVLLALYIHAKGHYQAAKRLAVYGIFLVGLVIASLSGGDFLYHIGVITVLTFAWILFDPKKERFELVVFLLLTFLTYALGEFNPFNAPDFSNHPKVEVARLLGLAVYTLLVSVFLFFIRSLNSDFGAKLADTMAEKELLLDEVLLSKEIIEKERNELEAIVQERTEELQQKTERLELQNKEKEVLLKEVHHRVKNNLQIIISLLNLQTSKVKDPDLLLSIKEMQNRIITMSLVHQRIYQDTSFDAIDFKEYIDLLYKNSVSVFTEKDNSVVYQNKTPESLKIDIDTAIPLGLIINELMTNSFKHAFSDNSPRQAINIALKKEDNNRFKLEYSDSGKGLPTDFSIETSSTLGMQLIDALAFQINGNLKFYNNNGAVFEILFQTRVGNFTT